MRKVGRGRAKFRLASYVTTVLSHWPLFPFYLLRSLDQCHPGDCSHLRIFRHLVSYGPHVFESWYRAAIGSEAAATQASLWQRDKDVGTRPNVLPT